MPEFASGLEVASGCEPAEDVVVHFLWASVWFPVCINDKGSSEHEMYVIGLGWCGL